MIAATNLSKRFGPVSAIEGLSFEIPRGSVCGFLGPNGSGKTTTLRILAGLLRPDEGRLRIGGIDAIEDSLAARRLVGYLPDGAPGYAEMRVEESLRFRFRISGAAGPMTPAIERVIEQCRLGEVRRRLVGRLSRGFRQRVGLAGALLSQPPVLLLDEPTEGLDPLQVLQFRELLREFAAERTVLLSSHLLPEVEAVCDSVILILEGRLVAAGPLASLRDGAETATIRLELAPTDPAAAETALAGLAAVRRLQIARDGEGGPLRIAAVVEASQADAAAETLAERLAAAGLRLRRLESRRPSLEELFLQFARRSARVDAESSA
jgi:ABC-2 type transport system ATP-binding protein